MKGSPMTIITHPASIHRGYSEARYILRNHSFHDLDAIDCAFEVLAYSTDEDDKALLRIVADEMWMVPSPSTNVIAITLAGIVAAFFAAVTLLAGFVQ